MTSDGACHSMHDVFCLKVVTAEVPAFLDLFGAICALTAWRVEDGVMSVRVSVPVLALSQARQEELRQTPGILSLRRESD